MECHPSGTWPGGTWLCTQSYSQQSLRPQVTKLSSHCFFILCHYWAHAFLTSLKFSLNFQNPSPSRTTPSTFLGLPESWCAVGKTCRGMKSLLPLMEKKNGSSGTIILSWLRRTSQLKRRAWTWYEGWHPQGLRSRRPWGRRPSGLCQGRYEACYRLWDRVDQDLGNTWYFSFLASERGKWGQLKLQGGCEH